MAIAVQKKHIHLYTPIRHVCHLSQTGGIANWCAGMGVHRHRVHRHRHRPGPTIEPMSVQTRATPPALDADVDVAVVGGGVIGLAVAWRARLRGLSAVVLERGAVGEECATHAAAGMLAPVAEADFGEAARGVLELGLRSARMWPDFAAELERAAGIEVGLRPSGTLVVARDDDEARELERQLAFRASLGLRATRLRPSAARELEPALAPVVRLALEAPDDGSVDPRLVLAALRRACELAGVLVREHAPVARVEIARTDGSADGTALIGGERVVGERVAEAQVAEAQVAAERVMGERVSGVTLAGGERVGAVHVVLAAGAWTAELEGLPAHARVPVRPVKGQIMRLRDPSGAGLLQRVVRFDGGYLVPRGDGRYVLGATVEERGFERLPTAGGVYELLRRAQELVPGVDELQIEELGVGFRPSTPDNAPAIGPGAVAGLVWATGHHRNGILLAPLTAELVADALATSYPRRDGPVAGARPIENGADNRPTKNDADNRPTKNDADSGRSDSSRSLSSACDPLRFATAGGPAARTHARPPTGVPS
jgi:glycine oxidase